MRTSIAEVVERATLIVVFALVLVLVWFLFDVILIIIGAVLVAVLFQLGAEPLIRYLKCPRGIALSLSGLIIISIVVGAGYLFGSQIGAEFQDVIQRASAAQKSITANLQGSRVGKLVLSHFMGDNLSVTDVLTRLFTVSTSFIEAVIITILTGAYLAAQPALYRAGLVKLFPRQWHPRISETIDDIGNALRLWLLGQLFQMLIIGVLSTIAAWLIGLPSPLALGLIAGLLEFVPYLGPIIAAIPAILVAATKDLNAVIWTIAAYILIHQIEGNLLVPLIQRRMVLIPPAVILLGIVAISFVFGTVSIIFAAPIAVVIFVMVKKLYVRDRLGERTAIPGETK
jgi:predicted PurR-regulated permease PerM